MGVRASRGKRTGTGRRGMPYAHRATLSTMLHLTLVCHCCAQEKSPPLWFVLFRHVVRGGRSQG